MPVELAAAYVSIVPTTKGLAGNLEKELSPLSGAAAKAGTDSGKALGSSFTGASGGLKAGVAEAEGHIGKFKAGATSALDSVGVSAGMLGAAGGAALLGFAVHAVGAFTQTAKAAVDMSTATGLSIEESSRWIAVADDMGVSAGSLQGSLGKIAKTLDSAKWGQYGIETRDAGGAAKSTNDILLDSFDMLGKIGNETERVRVGNDLFGKGYANLAPLIGKSRAEMEKYLGSVEKGQVITDAEAKKAEKMRLAEDALKDALGEVTLAVGAMVSSLAPLLELLAKVVTVAADGVGALSAWTINTNASATAADIFADQLIAQNEKIGDSTISTRGYSYATQDLQRATDEATDAVRDSTNSVEGYSYAVDDVAKHDTAAAEILKANAANTERAVKTSIDNMIRKWAELTTPITDDQAWINLQSNFIDLGIAAVDAFTAAADKTADAEQKGLDYQSKINDVKLEAIEYGKTILGLPQERLTNVLLTIDQGAFDRAKDMMDILTRNREMTLSITAKGGAGYDSGKQFAKGGFTPGGLVTVGEFGPEAVDLPKGSYVHTASDTRSLMSASKLGGVAAGGGMWPEQVTLVIEGTPFTAIIQRRDRDLAGTIAAGRRS